MLSLLLHMGVDGIGSLRVHHEGVASVVRVRDVLAVNRLADDVVQLAITVTVESTVVGDAGLVEVEAGFLDAGHQARGGVDDGGPVAVVNGLVSEVIEAGGGVLRLVDVGGLHGLPVLGRIFHRLGDFPGHGDLLTVRAGLGLLNELINCFNVVAQLGGLLDDSVIGR